MTKNLARALSILTKFWRYENRMNRTIKNYQLDSKLTSYNKDFKATQELKKTIKKLNDNIDKTLGLAQDLKRRM